MYKRTSKCTCLAQLEVFGMRIKRVNFASQATQHLSRFPRAAQKTRGVAHDAPIAFIATSLFSHARSAFW